MNSRGRNVQMLAQNNPLKPLITSAALLATRPICFTRLLIAALQHPTAKTCFALGHKITSITTDRLYYQKDAQPKREWYSGTLTYCARAGCGYEKFVGAATPWHVDRAGDPIPTQGD